MKFWYLLQLADGAIDVLAEVVTPHFLIYEALGRNDDEEELWTVTHSLTGYAAIYAPNRVSAIRAAEAMEAIAVEGQGHEVWGFVHVDFKPHGLSEKALKVSTELKASWAAASGGA